MPRESKRVVGGQVREVTLTEQAQHSVEVTQNSQGDFTVNIKLYFTEDTDLSIIEKARALYDHYLELFQPVPSGIKLVKKEG